MNITLIRPKATDFDILQQVAEIDQQAFAVDGISVFNLCQFARSGSIFALADQNSKVIAEAIMLKNIDDSGANIFGFAVNQNLVSGGYGTILMQNLIDFARKHKISYFELTVNPQDKRASNFYLKKFSFKKIKTLPLHPQKQQKRWLLRLNLEN
jgi:ribosomal protein S18 acetylase RimI-like enzyme